MNWQQKPAVSIDTLRFYEKQGLLNERHFIRGDNGYRNYNDAAVERLLLIRQAQAAGITLTEMRQAMDEWESGTLHPSDKLTFFQQKIAQVETRIAELERIKAYLLHKEAVTKAEYAAQSSP